MQRMLNLGAVMAADCNGRLLCIPEKRGEEDTAVVTWGWGDVEANDSLGYSEAFEWFSEQLETCCDRRRQGTVLGGDQGV